MIDNDLQMMKVSKKSIGLTVNSGSSKDCNNKKTIGGIKLRYISPKERERLRIPSYEYILP